MKLEALPLSLDADSPASVIAALPVFEDLLAGRRALLPVSLDSVGQHLRTLMHAGTGGQAEAPGTLIACTSGSTGTPKGARLGTRQLTASAQATATWLAEHFSTGPGPWLLALPPHHIAGVQVVLRSLQAGYAPQVLDAPTGFTVGGVVSATARLRRTHRSADLYTSLVPTQLQRLVADAAGRAALREYAAVLVGGAAAAPDLIRRCRADGIPVVLTYGSAETAGGMVYDGHALPGSAVDIDEPSGRILLSGPTVADGYRGSPAGVTSEAFPTSGTFRTSDLGQLTDGLLTVTGRADGAVNSGGLKILPEAVEAALASIGVTGCAVGVPDPDWGESVVALIEADGADSADSADPGALTTRLRARMHEAGVPGHLIPRRIFRTPVLPLTGPGKIDRRAVRHDLQTRLKA